MGIGDGAFLDSGVLLGLINDAVPLGLLVGAGYRRYFGEAAARYAITGKLGLSFF